MIGRSARIAVLALMPALALTAALPLGPTSAREIAADLSQHQIEITAGFDGAELLLYGHDAVTADVLVIVRGPDAPVAVRKKSRVAGLWINRDEVVFKNAPGFYFVGVTDGLRTDGGMDAILEKTGLGARFLNFGAVGGDANAPQAKEFRAALVELRARQHLYAAEPGRIEMRTDGLFRATIPFPSSTPTGTYTVTVYHIADGWPVAGAATPLEVRKAGFGAFVFWFAHEEPALYGVIAILIALGAGWFGGWAFKRS